ncbi:MAG: DUF4338 domain-containing protein [Verrucomicrobia bacterium]|nr:DUF4338 domain-containing protein [Verrucomicrobiota bacterium]MDA1088675.1 DUF4338 domain-containing protein [Verrucomicrobiota bacterium]
MASIRGLLADNPTWNRSRLSRELCERWDWRNEKGRLKDMAARTLLLKLERLKEIRLPTRQRASPNAHRNRQITEVEHDCRPIESDLKALRPLRVEPLAETGDQMALFKFLLQRYHYLGHRNCVGENLKYLVTDRAGRLLGCMLFGSAAWKAKSRDDFIGWDRPTRERNLPFLTNNTRFLILPWVRVKCLASHVLARVCRDLPGHWMQKYGHPIHLLETFVERERFRGTCYRAAGWTHVGATAGRSRNDVHATMNVPVKDIFLYPLTTDFRGRLCA